MSLTRDNKTETGCSHIRRLMALHLRSQLLYQASFALFLGELDNDYFFLLTLKYF
jgi:hypothetical protein